MRVALLHPTTSPEAGGEHDRFARGLGAGLLARGHRARLVTSHPGPTARAIEDGVAVTRHRRPPRGRLVRRGFEPWLTHLPATWWDLRRGRDDVAHALHPADGVAALRAGRPLVLSVLGTLTRAWLAGARRRPELVREATGGAGAVVALGPAGRDALWRWLGVEARVIAPGVDLARFAPDPRERAAEPTILCAAGPEPHALVEAFGRVRRERPAARLLLGAPTPFSGPGIEGRRLDGAGALARAHREAWVTAFPSPAGVTALAPLESLACGTPVVAVDGVLGAGTDGGDVARRCPSGDPAELASALLDALELAAHPATAVACRAQAGRFTWEAAADAYVSVYEEVLG